MNISAEKLRLYAISDRTWLEAGTSLTDLLPLLFENGVTCFQLREKHLTKEDFLKEAIAVQKICRFYKVPLIINDAVDIAREIGADGVHVGLSDMGIRKAREILGANAIIGGSAHNTAEALAAQAAGADYIGCGAIFGSTTKTDVTTLSLGELQKICTAVTIPAVAIGGITAENIPKLRGCGIAGAAVISAIFAQSNIATATKHLRELVDTL